ncbi:putative protein N(5)-glutamine methyltransferase [Rhodococcus spelaei]|uniref:peptide chain release factor N(5)-glutamine methyltransferase n=1 Tax=Rhodococcus spelaei TaxID=2546320 RepID=A0A541BLV9_9NOCA|nr:putative protein N(5)-glutamine methyltransferase [Rhodococcus spelaei]TQF73279.1 putative protein N(5)-glutamine methyltransferase [Rhodococcus spelaei]
MTASASPFDLAAVVGALRAAGCVFAEDEAGLLLDAANTPSELAAMIERRTAGLPLEQVLGWAEFRGLRIAVDVGVFVPRRRTEFLVHQAAALLSRDCEGRNPPVVVDLCCGSGAVGAALVASLARIELHASDIDGAAVACARRNLPGGRVHRGDLYGALPGALRGRVDVLAVNAPYVPTDAVALMPPEARLHEPRVALDGGTDGVDIQRRVAAGAPAWLAPNGHLLIETSRQQAPLTAAAFADAGLVPRVVHGEDVGATVVVGARRTDQRPG